MPLTLPPLPAQPQTMQPAQLAQMMQLKQGMGKQQKLERARKVLAGQEDVDTRSYLQRSRDKSKGVKFEPMTPEEAMSTIQVYDPDTYEKISSRTREIEKERREKFESFGADVNLLADDLIAIEDPIERTEYGKTAIGSLLKKYPDIPPPDKRLDADGDGMFSVKELKQMKANFAVFDPRAKQQNSEFERLLEASNLSQEEKQRWRKTRIEKLASGESDFMITVDPETKEVVVMRGDQSTMTSAQQGKRLDEFKQKEVATRRFVSLSNDVIDAVSNRGGQLGVVGAIARLGDEITSIAKNIDSELGVDTSDISKNIDDYDFGSLAAESAELKTNTLSLALIFASASGLGEGRALTDKDVQRSIEAIGGSTNSVSQLTRRLSRIQKNLADGLQIEADTYPDIIGKKYTPIDGLWTTPEGPDISKPLTPEEIAALPSGTEYVGPDGKKRRKR